jgi:hypothetical protein
MTVEESLQRAKAENNLGEMNVADSRLKDYSQEFLAHYRATLERFFSNPEELLALLRKVSV